MKTVCIVGAGPAGLAAAKTFLQTGQFTVTVYEKSQRLGGIWALDEQTSDAFLSPHTPTNLSRFTVALSDLDWRSVDLQSKHRPDGSPKASSPPLFPKAWQVYRYLEAYRLRYVPEHVLRFGYEVVRAERSKNPTHDSKSSWRITVRDQTSKTEVQEFDYLVVASGFFSSPRPLNQVIPSLANSGSDGAVKTIHSSQFKTLEDLFPEGHNVSGQKVLLVGGGNSSGEAAAAVAMQLSDAQWSPNPARRKLYEGCKVVHVMPRSIYPLPPFLEHAPGSRTYLPVDLKLYDYSRRPAGAIEAYGGPQTPEVRTIVHNALQKMVGGDQSDLGSEVLVSPGGVEKETAYVALAESYAEFARSGMIDGIRGRVTGITHDDDADATSVTVKTGDQLTTVKDIGAIVYATGYTPSTALNFLADEVKQALQFDADSTRLPLILEQWQTSNPAVPHLAFLGFYEGPYWPMIEMQARVTAERWLNDSIAPQPPFEGTEALLKLRKAMQEKAAAVPQYWFGDYLGHMEATALHLGLERNDGAFSAREGCPSPARYLTHASERATNEATMRELYDLWHDCIDNGKYVPRAAFRAMQGHWTINRRIVSQDPNFSGTLEGHASFHPRFPTPDKTRRVFDLEYLYIESGTFTSSSGLAMRASRRYVYRYAEAADELSVWFVKPDSDLEVDYLFHKLAFVLPGAAREAKACVAKADHLCVEDMYWTQYTLPIVGIALREFEVRHTVKGPNKDYVATTQYSRPQRQAV